MSRPEVTVDCDGCVSVDYDGIWWGFTVTLEGYTPEQRQTHDCPEQGAEVFWDYHEAGVWVRETGRDASVPTLPQHVYEDADEAVRAHFIEQRKNDDGGVW